jgi:hypothetical protein
VCSSVGAATLPATKIEGPARDGVFVAGDMGRGQSLVAWAITEATLPPDGVDAHLIGRDLLPRPIQPIDGPSPEQSLSRDRILPLPPF